MGLCTVIFEEKSSLRFSMAFKSRCLSLKPLVEGSLMLQGWAATWHEQGVCTRCRCGKQERGRTSSAAQLPVVLNRGKRYPDLLPAPVPPRYEARPLLPAWGGGWLFAASEAGPRLAFLPERPSALSASFVLWLHLSHSRRHGLESARG